MTLQKENEDDIEKIKNVSNLYDDPVECDKVLHEMKQSNEVKDFPVQFKRKDGGNYKALLSLVQLRYNKKESIMAIVKVLSC